MYHPDYKADHACATRRKHELTEGTTVFNCTFYHLEESLKKPYKSHKNCKNHSKRFYFLKLKKEARRGGGGKLVRLSAFPSLLSTGECFTGFTSLLILNLAVIARGKEGSNGRYVF